jgi:hypothetical protein
MHAKQECVKRNSTIADVRPDADLVHSKTQTLPRSIPRTTARQTEHSHSYVLHASACSEKRHTVDRGRGGRTNPSSRGRCKSQTRPA